MNTTSNNTTLQQDLIKIERQNVVKALENLVHKRFNLHTLQKEIEKIFGVTDVELIECYEQIDNCFMFGIIKPNIGGVFDIMYFNDKICRMDDKMQTQIKKK